MRFHARFAGHLAVRPALNDAEYEYLTAFADSRRHRGRGHPYAVPGHPRDDGPGTATDDYNEPAEGQPDLWCPWTPSCEGNCLAIQNDGQKVDAPVEWLKYVVAHFLRPKAKAASSGLADFDDFTFDHRVSGAVAMFREDTGALTAIRSNGLSVTEQVLAPGEPMSWW
jgi:hypothetical protein